MKNVKEKLYFKRREKLQIKEDIKNLNPKLIKRICWMMFFGALLVLGENIDSSIVCMGSIIGFLGFGISGMYLSKKIENLEKSLCRLDVQIIFLHKDFENQMEMNS